MHHRTIDPARLPKALAQAAIEELRPQTLPSAFVHTYCSRCDHEQAIPGPATAAAAQVQFMQNLADGATYLSALREACQVIEDSARDAFFRDGMSQAEFEFHWRADELKRWANWERLKRVAGLPLTEPEPVGCSDE